MNRARAIRSMARQWAPRDLSLRLLHEAKKRSGYLRLRYRASDIGAWCPRECGQIISSLGQGGLWTWGPGEVPNEALLSGIRSRLDTASLRTHVRVLKEGLHPFFFDRPGRFPRGSEWLENPFTGQRWPNVHWDSLAFSSPDYGDLKVVLDPARFPWAFTLARAAAVLGDADAGPLYCRILDDWVSANPPQAGPLWICGQECAFRIIALAFSLNLIVLLGDVDETQILIALGLVRALAARIAGTLGYAVSQRNNHSISEAVGLLAASRLLHPLGESQKWARVAVRVLRDEAQRQFAPDGSYVQQSLTYHRLALELLAVAIGLLRAQNRRTPTEVMDALKRGTDYLAQMVDPLSGHAPVLGPNDGALALPLTSCGYRDFRPALQMAGMAAWGVPIFPSGPWDEAVLWLCGAGDHTEVTEDPQLHAPSVAASGAGGCHIMRTPMPGTWALVRCLPPPGRISDADQLHVDVWHRGANLVHDAGTYSYNEAPPWSNALRHTQYHNTCTVDGESQAEPMGRFRWGVGVSVHHQAETPEVPPGVLLWQGWHDGYQRYEDPVVHARCVLALPDEQWCIIDRLTAKKEHHYRLHWLLQDCAYQWDPPGLTLRATSGDYHALVGSDSSDCVLSLAVADAQSPRGWWAPHYYSREPALSLAAECRGAVIQFCTVLGPHRSGLEWVDGGLRLWYGGWCVTVELRGDGDVLPVRDVACAPRGTGLAAVSPSGAP